MDTTALIISDIPSGQRIISQRVEETLLFSRILYSGSGTEALSQLQNHSVDMIFFGGQEGICRRAESLLKMMGKRELWRDIPVILMTFQANSDSRIFALECGASDCIDFNTSVDELRAMSQLHLRLKERADLLRKKNEELSKLALMDQLTGVYNRGFFDACLESEIARTRRTDSPVSLLLLDLDHFKKVNDNYGHTAGDAVLKAVASVLNDCSRESNVICRYGGEEFAIILRDTSANQAYVFAERLRKKIENLTFEDANLNIRVSASIGISDACGREAGLPSQLIDEADSALYTGKRNGRNRTEVYVKPALDPAWEGFPNNFGTVVGYA